MRNFIPILCLVFLASVSAGFAMKDAEAKDSYLWRLRWLEINDLIQILESTTEGSSVLLSATKRNPELLSHIRKGTVSMTESTFSRKYSVIDGREEIFVQHEVTINKNLTLADAVVDLAHELTHFAFKELMNPYGDNFKATEFIKNGIESKGGELHALSIECRVAWELSKKFPTFPEHSLCKPYKNIDGKFDLDGALADYYAVGEKWHNTFSQPLRSSFPLYSGRKPRFTSSYAKKPYPIALLDEYLITRRAACINNNKKYLAIISRGLASIEQVNPELKKLKTYDSRYCQFQNQEQHSAASTR